MRSVAAIEGRPTLVTRFGARERLERGLHRTLLVTFYTLLLFGPLALGVVQDWSIAVFEGGAALLFVLWLAWRWAAGQMARGEFSATGAFGIFWPARALWSPLFAPMLAFLGLTLLQIVARRPAYLHDSLAEFWLCIAYGILAFVAAQVLRGGQMTVFAKVTVAFASAYAVFAVLQSFTSNGTIYWLIKPRVGNPYGSYVNHNHYAGLMELLLPLALMVALDGSVWREARFLFGFTTIVMAASGFLCGSRGGMIGVIVEMIFLGVVWVRHFPLRKSAAIFALFCLATALSLAWIAPQQVVGRITDYHDPARLQIHRDSIRMFLAHPLIGSGLGSFPSTFPHYRVFYDGFFTNHAHDDYLEILLETGLLGFGLGVWFILLLYRGGLKHLRLMDRSFASRVSVAALAGCTGLLAHSFLDFNLHIPANAAIFYVLCVVAVAPSENRMAQ